MHEVSVQQEVKDRIASRRGKAYSFDNFDPRQTALVVVDLQNAYLLESVAHVYVEKAKGVVPNVNKIAGALRKAGGKVVWVQTVAEASKAGAGQETAWEVISSASFTAARLEALSRGSKGYELWDKLEVDRETDLFIEKKRFSAFIQGSSNVDEVLKQRGIKTLLVVGTATNVCCDSTARDAAMLGYRVIMVSDGNAAGTDAEHSAALTTFYSFFGDVMPTQHVLERLGSPRAQG